MIDDMALLKQAMEQMDAEDPAVAQTAKDRATAGTNPGRGWLLLRRPRCPIASARFTIARTVTDGCSVAARMDVFSSYTKPTCLPAERRPKSRLETFSEGAKRAPSIKRLRA